MVKKEEEEIIFDLDSEKSLFKPMLVKIGGRVYAVNEMTLDQAIEFQKIGKQIAETGDLGLTKQMMEMVFGSKVPPLGSQALSLVMRLGQAVITRSLNPPSAEKNSERPADKVSR